MKNPRHSVTLSKPAVAYLTKEAKRIGITVSELIRRIVDDRIDTHGDRNSR